MLLTTENDGTYISFDTVKAANNWIKNMVDKYPDQGIIFGKETDNLVRAYNMFRMNFQLYHIILYAVEGELIYHQKTQSWRNLIKKPTAKSSADIMLSNYDLQ